MTLNLVVALVQDGNIRARAFQDCVRDFQVCVPSTNPSEMTLNFSSSMTLNLAASDCNIFGFSFGCLVDFSRGYLSFTLLLDRPDWHYQFGDAGVLERANI